MNVGVRDLKTHLSAHLERVKAGETITVTEHGRPVAQLTPLPSPTLPPHLAELIATGRATWSGQRPELLPPIPLRGTGKSISEMVSEDRR